MTATTNRVALVLAGAALLAGCSGTTSNSSTSPKTKATAAPTAQAEGTVVTVTETEWAIALSTTTFTPGVYTFVVKDAGHASHALEIDGPGVSDKRSAGVSPGDSTRVTVTLQKGTYDVYCPVGNHADMGMRTSVTVT